MKIQNKKIFNENPRNFKFLMKIQENLLLKTSLFRLKIQEKNSKLNENQEIFNF